MKARERLQHIVNHPDYRRSVIEPEGSTSYDGHEDAAALRELDQLILDMRGIIKVYALDAQSRHPKIVESILDRAAQAGYGEK